MTTDDTTKSVVRKDRSVFVTVGTTLFDKLIEGVTTPTAVRWMKDQGYNKMTIQYGKGQKPTIVSEELFQVVTYDFASSLEQDMIQADLIISHAGAGTVMEALRLQKRLMVVINTDLMNNHQTELASAMHERKLLYMVESPNVLQESFGELEHFVPLPHQEGDEFAFPILLDSFLGFDQNTSGECCGKKRE
ncbi:glycosyltransferase [Nitzschia inconspicua]|uniref:UDP-N-acetylglucosamine transferase subunit ALG13 n=1 Tax=Nitzschia inconspicua TaxID=303405 RepID=A0A9K3Q700_9STRA|nr:glycosyltransferase [Nitzschia inconspicua]